MANQQGNGRNTSMSDEDRSSWRPDEDTKHRDRDEERMYRDRFRDDDRRGWDRGDSRSGGWRSTDRGGQGQSGYGAGREGDRSYQSRNSGHPGSFDERGSHYLAQGGQQMGGWGNDMGHGSHAQGYNRYGYGGRGDEQHEPIGQRIKGWFQGHRGKGPAGYVRSDDRIRETVCEALSDDDRVDATNIEVQVKHGEVTLAGVVDDRMQKRMAEECIENLSGVKDVQNQLRVSTDAVRRGSSMSTSSTTSGSMSESEKGSSPNGTEKRNRA